MGFAEILSQKGLRTEAIQNLEKFIAENTDASDSKMLLASLYRDNNQEQKARPLLLSLFHGRWADQAVALLTLRQAARHTFTFIIRAAEYIP